MAQIIDLSDDDSCLPQQKINVVDTESEFSEENFSDCSVSFGSDYDEFDSLGSNIPVLPEDIVTERMKIGKKGFVSLNEENVQLNKHHFVSYSVVSSSNELYLSIHSAENTSLDNFDKDKVERDIMQFVEINYGEMQNLEWNLENYAIDVVTPSILSKSKLLFSLNLILYFCFL